MTNEQIVLAEIRKNLEALSPSDRAKVETLAQVLRSIVVGGGAAAVYALALVGAEQAAQ